MSRVRNRSLSSFLADASVMDPPPGPAPAPRKAAPAGTPGAPAANPLENETARRMLEIAERLFAEHGVELVPLRQIVVEAGQRNRSALHYHFGSREALVSHLLNFRLAQVNVLRDRYLDEVEAAGLGGDVRTIVEASISALADTICDTPWGARYVKVLAQATLSPGLVNEEMIDPAAMSGVIRARRLIAAALPGIPRKVMHHRQQWFNQSVVYALAQWCQQSEGKPEQPPVADLADYCTAALTAPVSKGRRVWRSSKGRAA
ncbi:TetR family transcriptional regulator [Cupriavidus sp. USMAA2-4]|uniref:TetR family transcriptional regulator n=2 Tax=Cupriavidus malaysiensis TaxID=367825 RepID=A0ABM6F1R0_9BURK|nr:MULTISPECIES: TetR/AcrR family transcriptional regulator [unclassified Cupriavidus]AOY91591.1 TetR family transcriptional regulator [Cupriavidus sp. USMAA2-4]AOY98860.1 TetR family transcriptional regulator [Cupriavidus sp. USMAHM13]AOZ05284.1 TetR family transcriptional regulator [Cupriavidus malaysiensis]